MGKITLPAILTVALVILIIIGGVHYRNGKYKIRPHPDTASIRAKMRTLYMVDTNTRTYLLMIDSSVKDTNSIKYFIDPTSWVSEATLHFNRIKGCDSLVIFGIPNAPKEGYKIEIISSRQTTGKVLQRICLDSLQSINGQIKITIDFPHRFPGF